MDRSRRSAAPAGELIVRAYRRLLGFVGSLGLLLVALDAAPPVTLPWLLSPSPSPGSPSSACGPAAPSHDPAR